jgi:hypothetical protein
LRERLVLSAATLRKQGFCQSERQEELHDTSRFKYKQGGEKTQTREMGAA